MVMLLLNYILGNNDAYVNDLYTKIASDESPEIILQKIFMLLSTSFTITPPTIIATAWLYMYIPVSLDGVTSHQNNCTRLPYGNAVIRREKCQNDGGF